MKVQSHTNDCTTGFERAGILHDNTLDNIGTTLSYLNVEHRSELPDHGEALVVDVAAHLEMLLQGYGSVVCLVKLCT